MKEEENQSARLREVIGIPLIFLKGSERAPD